MMSIIRSH